MNFHSDLLFTELCALVADLGKGGGQISPSVYDTAQVLRLYPPQDVEPALKWLLAQQQADGGWGDPETPYARDVPTLASILALHTYAQDAQTRTARDAGLLFLRQQAEQWATVPIDAVPIATEMILPYLIEEANRTNLALPCEPYNSLFQLRSYKSRLIAGKSLHVGTAPTHSWEALGKGARSIRPDHSGGIGHSPAATAAWLQQAEQYPDLSDGCTTARQYLVNAEVATGVDIPGVVPNVWPITGFELAYAPYALLVTSLLHHPAIKTVVAPLLDKLWSIMQCGNGVSFGDYFTPDVDDTGLAMAVLEATCRPVDAAVVLQFKQDDHFCTFHKELNPSILANAHALYGLAQTDERYPAAENFLRNRQQADGRWPADKLHKSWLYTTLEAVLALNQLGYASEVKKAVQGLISHQKIDHGWGSGQSATRLETSYALIMLSILHRAGLLNDEEQQAMQHGYQWLRHLSQPYTFPGNRLWFGKELYAPYRVDRIYEISALLSVLLNSSLNEGQTDQGPSVPVYIAHDNML